MKKLLVSNDPAELNGVRSMLEEAGISVTVRNEEVSGAIPVAPFMPEIWVVNDSDLERARALVDSWENPPPTRQRAWTCPKCGETVEAELNACWNCGSSRPESASVA